jgi:hypothetical protein
MIAALSWGWMGTTPPAPYCGKQIRVTNTGPLEDQRIKGRNNTIIVTVIDSCEACERPHVDLSRGAWARLTDNSPASAVGIEW